MPVPATGILYIDPTTRNEVIIDTYTLKMMHLLLAAMSDHTRRGGFLTHNGRSFFAPGINARYWHTCACGAESTLYDYHIGDVDGRPVVTNALGVHYLALHRSSVPPETFELLDRLTVDTSQELPPDTVQKLLQPRYKL